jgi:hypothetical protein
MEDDWFMNMANKGRPLFEAVRSNLMADLFSAWRQLRQDRAEFAQLRSSMEPEQARALDSQLETRRRAVWERMIDHLANANPPPHVWCPDSLRECLLEATDNRYFDDARRHEYLVSMVGGDMNSEYEHPIGNHGPGKPSLPLQTRSLVEFQAANRQQITVTATYPSAETLGQCEHEIEYPILACTASRFSRQQSKVVASRVARFVTAMWSMLTHSRGGPTTPWEPDYIAMTGSPEAMGPFENDLRSLTQCTLLWLNTESRHDGMKRRLRNALCLMQEAHYSDHFAIRLTLAVAAIEALVGQKSEGVAESLASRLSALLEPDVNRRNDSHRAFKRLYAKRSDVIHGTELDHRAEIGDVAAYLCAGVIRAVMQWMLAHDLDDPRRRERMFFDELDQCFRTGNPMEHIEARLSRCIPYHLLG